LELLEARPGGRKRRRSVRCDRAESRNYVADAPRVIHSLPTICQHAEVQNPDQPELAGEVAIDGAYFGGKTKPANRKADRVDRRTAEEQTGKRQVVVVAREIMGRTCRSSCVAKAPRCR
jgi:hypothetical protein